MNLLRVVMLGVVLSTLTACEEKPAPPAPTPAPPPAAAPAPVVEKPKAPEIPAEVKAVAAKEITTENADQAAAALEAELDAELK